MVDEEAGALVDHELFHQRSTHAHGHRADHLAAGRLRIEDTAGGTHGKHAAHADLGGRGIDADFDEVRAEGRLLVLPGEIAVLDFVFGAEAAIGGSPRQRHASIARAHLAVGELRFGGVEAERLRDRLAQLDAGGINAGGGVVAAPLPAGT